MKLSKATRELIGRCESMMTSLQWSAAGAYNGCETCGYGATNCCPHCSKEEPDRHDQDERGHHENCELWLLITDLRAALGEEPS